MLVSAAIILSIAVLGWLLLVEPTYHFLVNHHIVTVSPQANSFTSVGGLHILIIVIYIALFLILKPWVGDLYHAIRYPNSQGSGKTGSRLRKLLDKLPRFH